MDWQEEARQKLRRGNQILFCRDGAFLQPLERLLQQQNRRTVVLWALEFAGEIARDLAVQYPQEQRPGRAVEAAWLWATGQIKMPAARRCILDCHAAARDLPLPWAAALCHAVGQACATVHTAGHAMGLPLYELTSLVRHYGIDQGREAVEERMRAYGERLLYWSGHEKRENWAPFLRP